MIVLIQPSVEPLPPQLALGSADFDFPAVKTYDGWVPNISVSEKRETDIINVCSETLKCSLGTNKYWKILADCFDIYIVRIKFYFPS